MKDFIHTIIILIILMLSTSCTYGQKIKTGHEVFDPILSKLKSSTNVPVRLPNYIAAEVAEEPHGFSAKINKAKTNKYVIHIVTRQDCKGEAFCLNGKVTGEKASENTSLSGPNPVTLANGIEGQYVEFTCAASCGMGKLFWKQEDYMYSVQLKAGPKDYMIDIANSAITENVAE